MNEYESGSYYTEFLVVTASSEKFRQLMYSYKLKTEVHVRSKETKTGLTGTVHNLYIHVHVCKKP